MEIKYRDRTRNRRSWVICDVSTSMRFCSELMLSFSVRIAGTDQQNVRFRVHRSSRIDFGDFRGADADEAVFFRLLRMPSDTTIPTSAGRLTTSQ